MKKDMKTSIDAKTKITNDLEILESLTNSTTRNKLIEDIKMSENINDIDARKKMIETVCALADDITKNLEKT